MKRSALPLYIWTVVAVGAVVVVRSSMALADTPHLLEWGLFTAFAILTGMIRIASIDASISVSDTFFIASALLFGPAPATVALALDSFIFSWRRQHDWRRIAFNAVAPALSMWAASETFFALSGVRPLAAGGASIAPLVVPLGCLAVVYFILNSALTAVAVALDSRQSPFLVWRRHFLWISLSYFAAASVALGLILIIQQVGLSAVAIILPVVAIFHRTLGSTFGRLEDASRHVTQMNRLYTSTVETLAMAIDAKDDVTHSHVRRVQTYAAALARALGITDEATLKAIEAAALLHDTGKLAVPEHILNKPGGLTPAEFEQMKRHVDVGADILSLVEFPYPVVPIVRCHHENWDGSGYPRGVIGADIPIGARILSVVDCFDALTSDRPYRRRLSDEAALDILRERRGRMYDPVVVDMFIRIYRDVPIEHDAPEERQIIGQIHASRQSDAAAAQEERAPAGLAAAHAGEEVLAFVSLARLASGTVSVGDLLALSTNLIRHIVPGASGAWYVLGPEGDRLIAAEAFGPASAQLRGRAIAVGDRLTGWVAANRQVIVNSDAALDLGERHQHDSATLRSCLSVPLVSGGVLAGVLTLYAPERDAFTEDQGRLIQMIAPHVAEAIDAAKQRTSQPQFHSSRDLRIVSSR